MPTKNIDKIEERRVELIRELFSTHAGKEILWRILAFCEVYHANGGDTEYRRGINEGKRRVGLFIEEMLCVVPVKHLVEWKIDMKNLDEAVEKALKDDVVNGRLN